METLQTLCAELTDFLSMLDEPPHELVVRARAALAADGPAVPEGHQPAPPAAGEAVGPEWRPCVKLPITVHVREQRPGETHVSTREGITPVRPDDLIMRGVQGEEYPIGRELFEKTYRLGPAEPAPPAEGEVEELVARLRRASAGASAMGWEQDSWVIARAADLLAQRHPAPVPVAERPWEREGWCDEEGRCWCFFDNSSERGWQYRRPQPSFYDTHCLPHYALPLPAGEVGQ